MNQREIALKVLASAKAMNKPLGDIIEAHIEGKFGRRRFPESYWGAMPTHFQDLVRWAIKHEKTWRKKRELDKLG